MRGVGRGPRSRVRMLLDRVVEEGAGSGVFVVRRREKAVTLLLDATFRFLHPVAVRIDRETPRKVMDERLSGVIRIVAPAWLKSGAA